MNYKEPKSVTDLHLAFQVALDLKSFNVKSPGTAAAFGEQRAMCPYRDMPLQHDGLYQVVDKELVRRGMVRPLDGFQYEVTPQALVWASVFRLLADGTFSFFNSPVAADAWRTFKKALEKFREDLMALQIELAKHLEDHTNPVRIGELDEATVALLNLPELPSIVLPFETYQEATVLACREQMLRLQKQREKLEQRARDPHVLSDTNRHHDELRSILDIPNLADARDTRKPRVTDFVNVGVVEKDLHGRPTDEKFGILTAPQQFTEDFRETARGAFSRGRSFAVGFIDIDNFKSFNEQHDEVLVDRIVLPQFMRALEAYCYRRAYAYRQGGDEYLVLLHNANKVEAKAFFEGLQAHIATVDYPDEVDPKPRVSIGVHLIADNSEVTEFEAKKRANEAKKIAKDSGRNCVRFSTDPPIPKGFEAP